MLNPCDDRVSNGLRTPNLAKKVTLKKHWTTCRAMRVIMSANLVHFEANLQGGVVGHDPEFVHQLRLSLRRMRSAVRIFKPTGIESIVADLKWLDATLGELRDFHIFTTKVLPPLCHAFADPLVSNKVALAASREAGLKFNAVRDALTSERLTRALLAMNAWLATLTQWTYVGSFETMVGKDLCQRATISIERFSAKEIVQAQRKLVHFEHRVSELSSAARHRIRINGKRVRDTVEFFASLCGEKRVVALLKCLEAIQDQLGEANDYEVSKHLMIGLSTTKGFDEFSDRWLDTRVCEALVGVDEKLHKARNLRRL